MERQCDLCGKTYEAKRATSRFCEPKHRTAWAKGARPSAAAPAPRPDDDSENIAPALRAEFDKLGVLEMYEARTALRLARQLDSGTIVGAAFTSLSKELDRRVDALRLKGDLPGDPGQAIEERFEEKRLRLVEGA